MTVPEIKGTCIQSVITFLREEAHYDGVLELLPDEASELYAKKAVPFAWYSESSYLQLLDAAARVHGEPSDVFFHRLGRRIINDGLNTVYKVFMRIGFPLLVLKRSPGLWRAYFKGSELTVAEARPGYGEVTVSSSGTTTRYYCQTQGGGIYEAMVLTGVKKIQIEHPQCRTAGADLCHFVLQWQ